MLPICLNAVFAALTPAQCRELAATITAELLLAADRHNPVTTAATGTAASDPCAGSAS